ncbi:MAG: glutathione peroxidase [Planctomycetota bacterium]
MTAPTPAPNKAPDFYALPAAPLDQAGADLQGRRGKVTLVVNVASACGYTPQYAGLQKLHDELKGKGFAVVGFPSNDFGEQEPGDAAAIRQFCSTKYQVGFPLFAKVQTKEGAGQSPVYAWLKQATGQLPNWNFCKYLIGKDGKAIAFFASKVAPDDKELRAAIDQALR